MCDVSQFQAEHHRLQAEVHCIQTNSHELGLSVIHALAELRKKLRAHFAQEDFLCSEEAVSCHPALGPEADRVEREHVALLAELDSIIRHCRAGEDVRSEFNAFADHLRARECAENRILQAALGVEVDP